MKGYMYILKCADGTFYVGSTVDLEKRLQEHFSGLGSNYTRKNEVKKSVYFETYTCIEDAFKREQQVKKWSHKKKEALINRDIKSLHDLSQCRNKTHYKNQKKK